MSETLRNTLSKEERICSKLLIDKLFGGGSHSMSAFPLRMVYRYEESEDDEPAVRILVSVPKRCFKRAVKRNRVKRQIREAYRLNKHSLSAKVSEKPGRKLLLAFIWTDNKLWTTQMVEQKVKNLLQRLEERQEGR